MGNFSQMFTYLRKRAGCSQNEIAEKLGISRSAVSMYESGKREPDIDTLEFIADFFNVNMNTLLGKTEKKEELPPLTDKQKELYTKLCTLSDEECEAWIKLLGGK